MFPVLWILSCSVISKHGTDMDEWMVQSPTRTHWLPLLYSLVSLALTFFPTSLKVQPTLENSWQRRWNTVLVHFKACVYWVVRVWWRTETERRRPFSFIPVSFFFLRNLEYRLLHWPIIVFLRSAWCKMRSSLMFLRLECGFAPLGMGHCRPWPDQCQPQADLQQPGGGLGRGPCGAALQPWPGGSAADQPRTLEAPYGSFLERSMYPGLLLFRGKGSIFWSQKKTEQSCRAKHLFWPNRWISSL